MSSDDQDAPESTEGDDSSEPNPAGGRLSEVEPTPDDGDDVNDPLADEGLSAFIAASAGAARAEAARDEAARDEAARDEAERDESASLWAAGDADDDLGYAEVRRSSPGWAMSRWIISAVVAAAVVVLSFIMIPRFFTPNDSESTADTGTGPTPTAATTAPPAITYPDAVMAAGPTHYWKFEMQSAGSDSAGAASLEIGGGAAILGSSSYHGGMGSIDCSGTVDSRALSGLAETPAGDFSIEVWINTVTNEGGPIVTFGNTETGTSTKVDRVLYMAGNGKVFFGTQAKNREWAATELPVNNGTWRHIVGTMSTTAGLTLYVDGQPVATEADGTSTSDFEGYWRVCGDNPSGWTGNTGRPAFTGTIDDVAVYAKTLTAQEVLSHYKAATA